MNFFNHFFSSFIIIILACGLNSCQSRTTRSGCATGNAGFEIKIQTEGFTDSIKRQDLDLIVLDFNFDPIDTITNRFSKNSNTGNFSYWVTPINLISHSKQIENYNLERDSLYTVVTYFQYIVINKSVNQRDTIAHFIAIYVSNGHYKAGECRVCKPNSPGSFTCDYSSNGAYFIDRYVLNDSVFTNQAASSEIEPIRLFAK